jgi:hypothetical protein
MPWRCKEEFIFIFVSATSYTRTLAAIFWTQINQVIKMKFRISTLFAVALIFVSSCSEDEVGLNSLVAITNEPIGSNCPNGGQRIDVGIDKSRDNVLSQDEVQSTTFICNALTGLNSLVNVVPEPSGSNCVSGGQKINVGLDTNRNSQLDTNEIQSSSYVCNGNDGIGTLIKVLSEPTGANCEAGGLKIQAGLDTNKNGTLDDGEILNTSFICKPTEKNVRKYLIESNDQITKNDNSWTSYLSTNITVDSDASSVFMTLDMSATGVSDGPEIAFRGKLGDSYSNATLVKWVTYNALEKPHFEFLFNNVAKGQYETGVQWNAIKGGITTSQYQQSNSYNRLIIFVFP